MKPALKRVIWALAGSALVGALVVAKVLSSHAPAKTSAIPRSIRQADGAGVLKVATYVVRPMRFAETVSSTGTLRADEGVELQAEANGKIVAINFTEGTRVRKGDLLFKVNDEDLRATLERTTYRKELAQLRERRYAKLLQQHVVTQDDYDTVLSDVNVQTAEIALIRAQIARTEIRAPFDGVVGLRFVSVGAYVNATTRIATLQHLDNLKIDFSVPEQYVGRIKAGSPITFRVAGGESEFSGRIYAIDPRIDSNTRTMLIRAVCSNQQGRLLPGAFANVTLTLSELNNAILVPSQAVVPGLEEKNVFVISNGKAERRRVETGTRTASSVHVLAGLKAGDVVITSALVQLREGQAVSPLEVTANAPAVAGTGAP